MNFLIKNLVYKSGHKEGNFENNIINGVSFCKSILLLP